MTSVSISASRTYEVQIGAGLLKTAGASLAKLLPAPRTVCVVSDDTVFALWGEVLCTSLRDTGYTVKTFVFPHGEASKSTETLLSLWNTLAALSLLRSLS